MAAYEPYELEAYFGDFAEEYEEKSEDMLDRYDWDSIVNMMDDEIREDLHAAFAPCYAGTFLMWYMVKHLEKYGEDFFF